MPNAHKGRRVPDTAVAVRVKKFTQKELGRWLTGEGTYHEKQFESPNPLKCQTGTIAATNSRKEEIYAPWGRLAGLQDWPEFVSSGFCKRVPSRVVFKPPHAHKRA